MLSKIECFKIKIKIIHFTPDFSHYSVDFPLCSAQILLAMRNILIAFWNYLFNRQQTMFNNLQSPCIFVFSDSYFFLQKKPYLFLEGPLKRYPSNPSL